MRILGIETSCDDTAIGIVTYQRGRFVIEAQVTASQVLTHRKYGGVVPEVAAREHALTILPTITQALRRARRTWKTIDAIAVTGGPGLNTALLVGVETARTLSYVLKKPVVRVNHIEGHVVSSLVHQRLSAVRFPAVALIVSGGHTELIRVQRLGEYRLIGGTLDDAVGEAFDKVAKILGFPYPGGPEISRAATRGDATAITYPRALLRANNFDFSYSGLKTSVLYSIQRERPINKQRRQDVAASFQAAAVEPLVVKTLSAIKRVRARTLLLGGGVAANAVLRERLATEVATQFPEVTFIPPALSLCMDNGVMIAMAGAIRAQRGEFTPWNKLSADPGWELVSKK